MPSVSLPGRCKARSLTASGDESPNDHDRSKAAVLLRDRSMLKSGIGFSPQQAPNTAILHLTVAPPASLSRYNLSPASLTSAQAGPKHPGQYLHSYASCRQRGFRNSANHRVELKAPRRCSPALAHTTLGF